MVFHEMSIWLGGCLALVPGIAANALHASGPIWTRCSRNRMSSHLGSPIRSCVRKCSFPSVEREPETVKFPLEAFQAIGRFTIPGGTPRL